jgi:predicted hydrocarbon binding protein
MTALPQTCCTSEIGQLMAEGVEGVIGQAAVQAVKDLAGKSHLYQPSSQEDAHKNPAFADLSALHGALEELYGPSGGRGIALRAGRLAFIRLMQKYESALGWDQVMFRLQPTPVRLRKGLIELANLLSQMTGTHFAVEKADHCWQLQAEQCPFCWQRDAGETVCHFLVGLVQEYFAWASSGKIYPVSEVECRAAGGEACIIQIEKSSLD